MENKRVRISDTQRPNGTGSSPLFIPSALCRIPFTIYIKTNPVVKDISNCVERSNKSAWQASHVSLSWLPGSRGTGGVMLVLFCKVNSLQ